MLEVITFVTKFKSRFFLTNSNWLLAVSVQDSQGFVLKTIKDLKHQQDIKSTHHKH